MITYYAQCDGAEIPLCRSCRRHPDFNGPRDAFQPVLASPARGNRCDNWMPPPARPLNPPRTDTGD